MGGALSDLHGAPCVLGYKGAEAQQVSVAPALTDAGAAVTLGIVVHE